jgi:hypothetical protein
MVTRTESDTPDLELEQIEMVVNFYEEACDHPKESFEQITRRMFGSKGFPKTKNATLYKEECRKSFNLARG